MKVAVVGGGPAGLFFATVLKERNAAHDITVFERNPTGTTYGFGVGLTEGALGYLRRVTPKVANEIERSSVRQSSLTIIHDGERVPIEGNVFFGISRLRLLEILSVRAQLEGVRIFENHTVQTLAELDDFDLIVGADGMNSIVRRENEALFQTEVSECRNKWIWYATDHVTKGIELIFQQTPLGLFIGHTYRYEDGRNTFVVECNPETWKAAGLDSMSDDDGRFFCSSIFAEFLDGQPLISNGSLWFTPKIIRTRNWSAPRTTLLGDAHKTMHPTIGSGTRAAMEDAYALAMAFADDDGTDPHDALARFEREHRPTSEKLQHSAIQSIRWYESIESRLHLPSLALASAYMMRTGKIDRDRLRNMDPAFVSACDAAGIVIAPSCVPSEP